jgi:hypothetical protein
VITHRQGWLGGKKRNHATPRVIHGSVAATGLRKYRQSTQRHQALAAARNTPHAPSGP